MTHDHHDDTWDEEWDDECSTEPLEYEEGSESVETLESYSCLHSFHCYYSSWPGMEWSSHVTVYADGDELVIFQRAANYCRSDRIPHVEDSWREVARFLAHEDLHWALPDCAAHEANFDDDLLPWQDAVLRLSWVRDGEEKEFSPGTIACELPDAWLAGLHRRFDVSGIRWSWDESKLIRYLRWLHNVADELGESPVTMLLQAATEIDPEHGLRDDPDGFCKALGRAFRKEGDTVRDVAW